MSTESLPSLKIACCINNLLICAVHKSSQGLKHEISGKIALSIKQKPPFSSLSCYKMLCNLCLDITHMLTNLLMFYISI